jgi:hypothetical protein
MRSLAALVSLLLMEATGLPDPQSMTVYGVLEGYVLDEASLQFPRTGESRKALALWAEHFGGVITAKTMERDEGPQLWVDVEFTFRDVLRVTAFAHIPLPLPEAAHDAEQASDPQTVPV